MHQTKIWNLWPLLPSSFSILRFPILNTLTLRPSYVLFQPTETTMNEMKPRNILETIERHQCALLAHPILQMYQSDGIEAATEVAEVVVDV